MRVSAITNYNFNISKPRGISLNYQRHGSDGSDVFVSNIAFERKGKTTTKGNILKKLRNITCPYTGVKMIPGSDMIRIEKKIDECTNSTQIIAILAKYANYMQKIEKQMFFKMANFVKQNPTKTIQDYLIQMYDKSLTKLKLEEFLVIDEVDRISLKMSPETAFAVRKETTNCRQIILADDKEDTFKRKNLLFALNEIKPKTNEKTIYENMRDTVLYLPTSASSENAFVVKYANRNEKETAKRILRASVATIEHITPDSKGGKNELGNFIMVSENGNRYRENMPLPKYIKRHPNIPKYCQIYMNEIMREILNGKFDKKAYPSIISKKLSEESERLIRLTLPTRFRLQKYN